VEAGGAGKGRSWESEVGGELEAEIAEEGATVPGLSSSQKVGKLFGRESRLFDDGFQRPAF
jgi:hypothetical protein